MHRQGIVSKDFQTAFSLIRENEHINLAGVCSHLASSDSSNKEFTEKQIKLWNDSALLWKKEFPSIAYFHLSNTAGSSYSEDTVSNILRLGIGLYGIDPSEDGRFPNLKPALEMKSVISGTKVIKNGESIGYGSTFTTSKETRIATIPAGYYEGVDRRLSNIGFVKIGNVFCPIVGRVSMNITTIDVTNVPEARLNTPVTLISSNPSDKNSFANNAKLAGTIPYELAVHIPQGLRRKVV